MNQLIAGAVILTATFASGCKRSADRQDAPPAAVEVTMQNMQFSPATVEVRKGDVVEWKNTDLTPHTATSPSFGDSGVIAPDKT